MKDSLSTGDNPIKIIGRLQAELPHIIGKGVIQLGLISAAVALPAVFHIAGMPVRWILPMHLPVILAGLIYGWRSGLVIGLCVPLINWLLTGFPLAPVLPAMMIELAVYGGLSGWLNQKSSWRMTAALGVALIVGRICFLGTILLTGGHNGSFGHYAIVAMTPGIAAMFGQVLIIPLVFKWFRSKQ